ncbi:unnamed protein product, partial [marine sediment metagenome]
HYNRIEPRFRINNGQADLAVQVKDGYVVFEFMLFVKGADSRKKKRFPRQLDRLEGAVKSGKITQGIAFVTFNGYSNKQMDGLIKKFFERILVEARSAHWMVIRLECQARKILY